MGTGIGSEYEKFKKIIITIIIIIIFGFPLLLDQKVQRRAFSLQVNPRQSSLSKTSLVSVQERAVHLVTSHLSVFVHLSLLS